jgi:hypothetical protein
MRVETRRFSMPWERENDDIMKVHGKGRTLYACAWQLAGQSSTARRLCGLSLVQGAANHSADPAQTEPCCTLHPQNPLIHTAVQCLQC